MSARDIWSTEKSHKFRYFKGGLD